MVQKQMKAHMIDLRKDKIKIRDSRKTIVAALQINI